MILFLIKIRLIRAFKSILSTRKSNLFVYCLVFSFFLTGSFLFFLRIFLFLKPIEIIGTIIADKLISYSFFIFTLLLFMSNGITALSTLYHSEELDYLYSTPLEPFHIFSLKLIETVFYSSWATLIGGIPFILSYLIAFSSFQIKTLLLFLPLFAFILIPSGFGVSIIIILKKINPRWTVKQLAAVLGALSTFFIFVYIQSTPYNFNVPETLNLEAVNQFVQSLQVSNPYFPNEWLYKCISALANNNTRTFVQNIILLLAGSSISISIAFLFANLFYRISWMSDESNSGSLPIHKKLLFNKLPGILNILQKDIKIFLRSPLQWSQLMIIGVLLVIYIFSLRRTPLYVRDPFWLSVFALVNTGFIGYITATLSLRFVYPGISLEGRTWWNLRSSPLSVDLILQSKGIFFFIINLLIAESVIIFSNIVLTQYFIIVLLSAVLSAVFSFVSVYLNVSLGTLFADFRETNPAKIASGAGGLLTAAINLLYIAISMILFATPISVYIKNSLEGNLVSIVIPLIVSSSVFVIITLLIVLIPLKLAKKRIKEIE
jgi:ABC-2 type transport system permease protein